MEAELDEAARRREARRRRILERGSERLALITGSQAYAQRLDNEAEAASTGASVLEVPVTSAIVEVERVHSAKHDEALATIEQADAPAAPDTTAEESTSPSEAELPPESSLSASKGAITIDWQRLENAVDFTDSSRLKLTMAVSLLTVLSFCYKGCINDTRHLSLPSPLATLLLTQITIIAAACMSHARGEQVSERVHEDSEQMLHQLLARMHVPGAQGRGQPSLAGLVRSVESGLSFVLVALKLAKGLARDIAAYIVILVLGVTAVSSWLQPCYLEATPYDVVEV
eukprot:jgi/Chlat1/1915/Chrsp149S00117